MNLGLRNKWSIFNLLSIWSLTDSKLPTYNVSLHHFFLWKIVKVTFLCHLDLLKCPKKISLCDFWPFWLVRKSCKLFFPRICHGMWPTTHSGKMRFLKVADFNTIYNFLEIPNPWYDICFKYWYFYRKIPPKKVCQNIATFGTCFFP